MRSILIVAACLVLATPACAADTFDGYAPPGAFGPAYKLRAHLRASSYTVSYSVVGNTSVIGEVTYVSAATGKEVTVLFNGEISFRTADVVGQPRLRLKGVPLGSAVHVTVSP